MPSNSDQSRRSSPRPSPDDNCASEISRPRILPIVKAGHVKAVISREDCVFRCEHIVNSIVNLILSSLVGNRRSHGQARAGLTNPESDGIVTISNFTSVNHAGAACCIVTSALRLSTSRKIEATASTRPSRLNLSTQSLLGMSPSITISSHFSA